ncbi:MAG: hypothetical protein IJN80_05395 [Clostridia bacterium]|nr:hypothetical protein [Clostridia bacterium]
MAVMKRILRNFGKEESRRSVRVRQAERGRGSMAFEPVRSIGRARPQMLR